ncbi:hypothetical protein NGTWS1803_09560 [Mycolicibacterium cyprinidarum]|nr:hypothetical protein NGTWS1803_09560 [Mycolicibacterium sp. NGTWS1803]
MNLIPTPEVTITDAAVEDALARAVRIIHPLLDVLWGTDPLGLKRHRAQPDDGPLDRVVAGLTCVLNAADVPGTSAWDAMDTDARINWWVRRVGALNTVAVAFPGFLGAMVSRLPIQDLLGFANQAIVLCAVARELGVPDDQQVRMLAAVLCHRDLSGIQGDAAIDTSPQDIPRTPLGIAKALWNLMGLLDAIGEELGKRPHPRMAFKYVSMLPAVGAVAAYLGECGALARAAKAGQQWVAQQPEVSTSRG